MEFNDLSFLLLFLPIFVLSYYLFKRNKIVILVFSILFYLLTDIKYFYLLVAVVLVTYLVALKVKGNKFLYIAYIIAFIFLLCGFKYYGLIQELLKATNIVSVVLPIGISYYLFESFSYVSDCYYKKYEADKNLLNVSLYITFFPTIISGPIIRFDDFKSYLGSNDWSIDNVGIGLRRFFVGLAKKIIIANQLVVLCNTVFTDGTVLSTPLVWCGLLAYTLRLYYDFSACSDMAIGIGQMIGYRMPENFNSPYCSLSVSEFFRRWHISLGTWFRDYVYIPLGGNRKGLIRQVINLLIVWLCTGIWHGSTVNFIAWGLFLGLIIVIEKVFISRIKLPSIIKWPYTTFVIIIGWLMFSTSNMETFGTYFVYLFNGTTLDYEYFLSLGVSYTLLVLVIAILFMIPIVNKGIDFINRKLPYIYDLVVIIFVVISLWLIVTGTQATSIYFGF